MLARLDLWCAFLVVQEVETGWTSWFHSGQTKRTNGLHSRSLLLFIYSLLVDLRPAELHFFQDSSSRLRTREAAQADRGGAK